MWFWSSDSVQTLILRQLLYVPTNQMATKGDLWKNSAWKYAVLKFR